MVTKVARPEKAEGEVGVSGAAPGNGDRPMRADARRNRERLVASAKSVFAEHGTDASMEAVARDAGVGVGTLYRHFPTRLDLIEAVYETDVEELWEAAQHAAAELEPWPAVEAFFDAFVRYTSTKKILLSELHQAFEKNPALKSRARSMIDASFDLVVERAKEAGVVRNDVEGSDLTQLVSPICTNESIAPDQARRLIGMILDGMRATAVQEVAV
jgi:AcrR family transcriptional regulator